MADFQGVIFDMDGVLVDSEPIFLRAINRLITNEGVDPISEDENEEYLLGTTVELTWDRLRELRHLTASTEDYIGRYDKLVR